MDNEFSFSIGAMLSIRGQVEQKFLFMKSPNDLLKTEIVSLFFVGAMENLLEIRLLMELI
jgi:hypothetical protein